MLQSEIDSAANQAATSPKNDLPVPTPEQIKAGNYAKGHVTIHGLNIAIENPKGSTRSGVSASGKAWKTLMKHHYGYIKRSEGADGDHVDVFIGDKPESETVFVVNQVNPETGVFDEHKAMICFDDRKAASEAYLSNYEEGWRGMKSMISMDIEKFKDWLKNGDTKMILESSNSWVGVDLDGTLAVYDGWKGEDHVGGPVPLMMDKVKELIQSGETVKIFTARAESESGKKVVEKWLTEHGLQGIEVTNIKDSGMTMLLDDRAKNVIPNTGVVLESFDKKQMDDIILEMAESEWRAKLAQSNDIDDISEVFRALFNEPPSSGSPFFKDTFTSQTVSLDKLVAREEPNPERVKRAHAKMSAAKGGTGEKRSPVKVFDMGNGKFKVLDGNTTLQALKELGETEVVVEVKKSLKQQVGNPSSLDDVYEQAGNALPTFKEWVETYAQKTNASRVMLRPGLKGRERAGAKVKNDYGGCASRLTDIVGGTLLFDTVEQVVAAYKMIIQDKTVYKAKNRFENPTSDGYRDIMMVVKVGGHLCELQLNTHAILDAKEKGLGHKLYEITRELEPIAKQQSDEGDFDFVAQGYIDALRKVSVKLYRNAAMSSSSSSANSMASDSETLDEFNRILARLSGSSISDHFSGLRESIRKMLPVNFSIAKGTSSFSTKSNMSDFMAGIPPFDTKNITRNGKNVKANVVTGRITRAYLNDGSLLKLQYAVVDGADLVTSHNTDFTLHPEFPQELQPRDRTRDTMRQQIASIAGKLNPDLLGGSLYASVGSPIVGRDLVVESGNGRTMGIKTRYERDEAPHYREWLIDDAASKIGINPETVRGMNRPVLVRIRLSDESRTTVTERANEGDIASMSPVEQAKVDDRRLTGDDMDMFRPSDDGDITAASNRQFVNRFIALLGPAEAAGLLTADSRPTKKLVDRIQAAIFSKAYANDKLLALMAEETHPTIKNILTALTLASPVFAKIRGVAPDMGGIDLTDHVVGAAMLILKSRDESEPIEMILKQLGMFDQIPEETKAVARLLHANMRSAKRMGNVFKMAGQKILTYLQNRDQISMFGAPEKPTAAGVLKEALSGEEAEGVKQRGLFESAGDTPNIDNLRVVVSIANNQTPKDIPENWIVFNAPRPLYGHKDWKGEFGHGVFYAAIDPDGDRAAKMIEQNKSLDGWIYQDVDTDTVREVVRQKYIEYTKGDTDKVDGVMAKADPGQIRDSFMNMLEKMDYGQFKALLASSMDKKAAPVEPELQTPNYLLDTFVPENKRALFQDRINQYAPGMFGLVSKKLDGIRKTLDDRKMAGLLNEPSYAGNLVSVLIKATAGTEIFATARESRPDRMEYAASLWKEFLDEDITQAKYQPIDPETAPAGRNVTDKTGRKYTNLRTEDGITRAIAWTNDGKEPAYWMVETPDGARATGATEAEALAEHQIAKAGKDKWRYDSIERVWTEEELSGLFNPSLRGIGKARGIDGADTMRIDKLKTAILEGQKAKEAEPKPGKELWQMTRKEYRFQQNTEKLKTIHDAISAGKDIAVATQYRIVPLTSPDHIRIVSSGDIQIPRGKGKWDYLFDPQVDELVRQAGGKVSKTYHIDMIEQAMSEGKPVPKEVLDDYRDYSGISWRLDIMEAKTMDDIASVFGDVFGVYLDDDAVLESEKAIDQKKDENMILEKTPDTVTDIDFTSLIRGAKTFEDIESVFKQVFGVTLGTTNPNSYQDPTSEYGVRVRGVKAREKINTQCRDILDHVKFPEDLTEEDKAILRQYSGKGGLTENSQYEYYTPAHVAGGIWDSLAAHGFQNGNVLDPCTGAGVFSGTKPEQVVVTGCDIDPVGSKVAAFLNPGDRIETKPFEAVVMETPDNTFDAIVGNVPFGDARGKSAHLDPEYKSEKRIERYFILRALDKVKPGGLCAFVVPINIVGATGSKWEQFRIACSKKAEFLGAHKLPSKTFSGQGTDTVVDVVVFKKHSQEFLDKIQDTQFETLQQANVIWNEFVKGKYWMGEGKPFIMGKYVPKVAGDRWSREIVDGDIDNVGIRAKLAARFNSRIDWALLEVAEPIVRNYIEGDRRFINGSEHELISGQWVKVSVAISKNAIDPDVYGAASAEELTAILEDSKSVLKLTADQMWAAYKTFPDRCTALQKQAIEFAMSQSDDATRDQLFHGSIIGGMIGRYHQSVVDGTPDDSERLMIQDIVTSEISRYGHPKHNAKLNLTGESSRMYGLFMNAVDEHGNFSDLLAGTLETKRDSQYDSGNVQSIVEHLFNREGIVNIELDDIKRLYTGSNDLTLADIASDYDNLAITPELMIMPLGRFCSGDIYPKIQGMVDAMAGDDVDDRIKIKWRKQINEIDNRRIKTNPEDITFGLRQKWFSPEYVVRFLNANGYPNVDYVTKREVEKEDPVTGKITVRMVAETDYDSPFGEYVGISMKGFPAQFLKYLNGNNITSSVEENIVQYKNQAKILEENFDVFMKQNLDIAELGEQYNRKFNGFLAYDHDGSDLGLKDVSPQVKLHDYQNVAIRRMSEDGRGILGYDVGLGKTFSALGLIAYNNQMGRSKKTCIVVPDSVLENWYHSAKSFYGHTNDMLFVGYEPVLTKEGTVEQEVVLNEKGEAKKNRHTGEIEYQDKLKKRNSKEDIFKKLWEIPMTNKRIVVMSKEKFGMIPMMAETKGAYAEKMLKKALISDANARTMVAENSQGVKISYDDAKDRDRLEGLYSDEGTKKSGELPYFEMMGFTDVITDESHLYKNSYQGGEKTSAIAYLPNAPSAKRSLDMNMKMNFIRDSNNGRGVYGLTATPVTNSPIEIFNMLSLVCDVAEFERFGVYTIDDFVRVFGDIQQVDKQKVSGEITKKDGLVGFQNLGGLRSVFHKYVLLKNADDVGLKLPPHEDIHDGVHLTSEQQDTYDVLREMAKEAAKPGKKRSAEETLFGIIRNMDRVTTDMDLYRHTMTFVFRLEDRDSVDALIKNLPKTVKVKGIDEETKEKITYDRGLTTDIRIEDGKYILVVPEEFETHVVTRLKQFGIKDSDVSHPLMPKYAQLLENMKKELETGGKQLVFTEEKSQHDKIVRIMVNNIPMISEKIGIINAETASGGALQGISDSYNSGKLSVVIANKKAEVGVNLQKGTTAIHHLTLPWTPASIQQRNGRGIRQGNTAKGIRVYYYLGVGSFDQYRLDLLERKSNWIRDLFTGNSERAENANAFNADDYLDMLEADPEAAKQKRLEKLEQKRREEEDRERKRLSNQLQVLISITTALGGLTASQSDLQAKLTEKQADLEAKIKKIKAELTTTTDDEKRLKASQKLVTEQQALKKATDRLAGLEQEFQQKQIDLEARRKQITGYMQGLANKKKLPFSSELIDHPENALVTLSGHVLAVGDTFENIKDGGVYRIKEINLAGKEFLTEPLTVQWGGKWHRNADTFMTLYKRVSYSSAELDTLVMLAKEHGYGDLMKYDKAFFAENVHRMKFGMYSRDAFLMMDTEGSVFYSSWSAAYKIIFPEPQDPDFRKLAATTAVKFIRVNGLTGDLGRTLKTLFGDNYDDVLSEYRKNATETEILTAFANAYKKWFEGATQYHGDTASQVAYNFRSAATQRNIRADMFEALSEYDNKSEIGQQYNLLYQSKYDEWSEKVRAEEAEIERMANERLKSDPNYKEIPEAIAAAFKKIGITVRVNPGNLNYRVSKYKSETAKPFSRWLLQDSAGVSGVLYKTKEILKARYGAKFFKDEGQFSGAWWHLPSNYSLDEIYKLLS